MEKIPNKRLSIKLEDITLMFLSYLITIYGKKSILEIGTYLGNTCLLLCDLFEKEFSVYDWHIDTVDYISKDNDYMDYDELTLSHNLFLEKLKKKGTKKINVYSNGSIKFFEECDKLYDIIILDGKKSYNQAKLEIYHAINHLKDDGLILMQCIRTYEDENIYNESHTKAYDEFMYEDFIKYSLLTWNFHTIRREPSIIGVIIRSNNKDMMNTFIKYLYPIHPMLFQTFNIDVSHIKLVKTASNQIYFKL